MKHFVLAAFACAAGLGFQPAAAEIVYDCEMKPNTNDGGVPPRVLVLLDKDRQGAKVYDAFIHEAAGEPIEARISPRKAHAFDLSWTVDAVPVRNRVSTTIGHFAAVFNESKRTLSVRATFSGFANFSRARGKCKVKTD
ncbi:hypothetical protein RA19_20020 [Leisingera sp. ANG-M1]|uniref:hypothetical protein n=1 Tax=Leisingera sp. ANG-M1 TaxID=1577895 RepID=UPI00057F9E77|nr:hypothetical protein [Leisingera sp. ANG-M1]KIC08266.1 hypothetical protein RA19_20020 [Leisingera sp. ANG-M1]